MKGNEMNLMNITKISRYCGFFLALLVLAVVLPTADAQDNYITDSYFPPKPENVVSDDWTPARTTEPAPEVWMPDADLRAAVEAELSAMDPPLTLTQANLSALLSIESDHEVNGRSISNLKGLEYATRLTSLFLRGNSISNISVLSNLTNIQNISLEKNNVSDISILSNLTALTYLNVGSNTITDISALSDLTGMQYIYLSGNNVTDISALSDLTSLHRLYLEGNNISDISALSDMTELTILTLGRNNTTDIENLSDIIPGNNTLSDISYLSRLVKLEELYISSNSISDISHLSGLTKLEILNLGGNSVSSLTALSNLTELEHLYLWNNSISDISPIAGLTNLQSLDLRWNSNFSDISYLSDLDNVEQLYLSSNIINIITALMEMDGLVRVALTQNPVWNIPANVHTVNTLRNERSVEVLIDDLVTPGGGFPTDLDVTEPTVSFDVPSTPQNAPFDVSVIFNETVSGFELTELVLEPMSVASISSTAFEITENNTTYTAKIKLRTSGTVTFSVAAGVAIDSFYNPNIAATSQSVTIDLDAPGVSINDVPSGTQNAPFDISIVFTEEVDNFVAEDVSFGGNGEAKVTDLDSTDDITFTAEITPVRDGNIILSVAAGVATDAAGNQNTASTTQSVTIEGVEPGVTLTVPSGVQNNAFQVTFTFTEPVSGFDVSDIVLGGIDAIVSSLEPNPAADNSFIAIITPTVTTPGNITIDVPAEAVTNDVGTPNIAATRQAVSVDLPPNVSVTVLSDVQNGPFDVSVVFTEAVNNFVHTDLVLGGDTMASITATSFTTTDNITYIAEITPTLSGEVTFDVAAGVATDASNLDNTAAEMLTVTVDLFVEIPDSNLSRYIRNRLDLAADASVTESQMASLTFISYNSENRPNYRRIRDLTGLEYAINLETLSIRHNRVSDPTPIVNLTNLRTLGLADNNIDSISFLSNLTNLEELYLWRNDIEHISGLEDLTALTFLSLRRNPIINNAANRSTRDILRERLGSNLKIDPFVDDTTDPEVEISIPSGTQNAAFQVTFIFTEPISGFDASDVVLDGTSADFTEPEQDSADEKIYTTIITPTNTLPGNITIDIPADAVTDEAGNGNTAATTQTVAVDLPPNVSFNIPSSPQYGEFNVKIRFSDAVTDFVLEDIVLGGTATAEITNFRIRNEKEYIVEINPTSKGDLTISVPAGVATDAANNGNIAATSEPMVVDVDFVIELPDANLGTWLRHALDLNDGEDITKTQMLSLTLFGFSRPPNYEKISDLSGLEHATNLKKINLHGHSITDFTVFEQLPKLTQLTLSHNGITDITGIANLTHLTYLNLRGNNITDVSPLENLTGLGGVSLRGNPILDTSPLYRMLYNSQYALTYVDISVSQYPPWDVNEDGSVDATDSALVTAALGQTGNAIVNSRTDVNGDGTVDQDDLTLVTDNLDTDEAAPSSSGLLAVLDQETLQTLDRGLLELYLNTLRAESDGSLKYLRAIAILERVLEMTRPKETQLLANYPNPFNPETWIPYHLANASKVRITIYDVHGTVVRRLDLGHQREGYYTSHSRAAYWDGRNDVGERIASGIYFYQLQADNVSLLRKMVILK